MRAAFPFLMLFAGCALAADRPDISLADFEGETYAGWETVGTAFGKGPARGALRGQMNVEGFAGKGLVNSFNGGDTAVGTLTSPEFTIERKFLRFLIGGGGFANNTCVNLRVDGKVVRTAAGPNTAPGGSERLEPSAWDVAEFDGKKARLEIVDQATGSWGHINADDFALTDKKTPGILADATRDLTAEKRWLNFPVKTGGPKRTVTVAVEGRIARTFEVELALETPDWWAPLDISAWQGKKLTVTAPRMPEDSKALSSLDQSDELKNGGDLYREPLRPQFHFSARRGWLNDPNGLAFYNGEYHLFFQHNPYGWNWGNMHWGHAVSKDLVHWEELGEALYPDESGTMFSGSAVVDEKNVSGLGKPGKPPLLLFYTAAGKEFTQGLAFSTDGRVFTKYSKNPIVPQITNGNRDPKVIWHAPSNQWVMTLYVEHDKKHFIEFLTSTNLLEWKRISKVEGLFECPDLIQFPQAPKAHEWLLTAASSEYFLGSFDGATFTPNSPKLPGHRGKGFYAAQTFFDLPDKRIVQIGWGQMPSPGMSFNQMMCFPCELSLLPSQDGAAPCLAWQPVKEIRSLRKKSKVEADLDIPQGAGAPISTDGELLEIRLNLEGRSASTVSIDARGCSIIWSVTGKELAVNGRKAPLPAADTSLDLTILIDRTSVEVFAAKGSVYIPVPFTPASNNQVVTFTSSGSGGNARARSVEVHQLGSAWEKR